MKTKKFCAYCDSTNHQTGSCPHMPHGDRHRKEAPKRKPYQKKAAEKAKRLKPEMFDLVKADLTPIEHRIIKDAPRKRTKAEIKAMIKRLTAVKLSVPERNIFGDNNWHAIEAQIYVLKHNCDEDEVAKKYLPASGDGEPTEIELEEGMTVDIEILARETVYWRDDVSNPFTEGDPATGWENLAASWNKPGAAKARAAIRVKAKEFLAREGVRP